MYGKFFASTFKGSMVGAGPDVFAVWSYIIAHTTKGTVELQVDLVATALGCSVERVNKALEVLEAPDPRSRNPEQDGRRIVQNGPFSYFVVSHAHYRSIRNEDDRREYNRVKQRESRGRRKQSNVSIPNVNDMSAASAHADRDPDPDSESELRNASLRSALNNSQPRASSDQTEKLQKEVSQNNPAGRTIFGGGLDRPTKRDPSTFGSGGSNGASAGQGPRGPMSRSQEALGGFAAVSAPTDTSEEPESPQEAEGAGSAPENDSPAERLSRAAATVVAVQTRVVLDKLRKNRTAQLKSEAVDARPAEKKPRVTKGKIPQDVMLKVRALETQWRALMASVFPDIVTASWGGKECSQAAQLLGKYGFDVTGLSFDYVVMNWETIGSRSFKGIGGVPSVGFLLSRHEVLVAEAQQWTKIRDFQLEYRAWRQANRMAMVLPQPLEMQRRALQPAAKTLGIVL